MNINSNEQSTLLRSYKVIYISGFSTMPNLIRGIYLSLYAEGFLVHGYGFSTLWIPYNSVVDFELSTGSGDVRRLTRYDASKEKMINISYLNADQQKLVLKLEMSDAVYIFKNFAKATELVSLMRHYKIFDKFSSYQPSGLPADIITQIEKLAELNKSGILTDEEFQSKKTELLKKI